MSVNAVTNLMFKITALSDLERRHLLEFMLSSYTPDKLLDLACEREAKALAAKKAA